MRRAALASVLAAVLVGGCDGKSTKTVTVTTPGQSATAPSTASTSTAPTTAPSEAGGFRKPASGEGELTIEGTPTNGETRRTSDQQSDLSAYGFFELQPNDGSSPLRVGVAGDLDLDPAVRRVLLASRCSGRLHGTFRVTPAPARESRFDWQLLSATLRSTSCGP